MAEQKGGTDDGEESQGEFLGLRNVDDSGIESGEDLRGVNPEVIREVEDALGRLEGVMYGLDPSRREAVTKLVSSLQSCLKLPNNNNGPPKRRQTVGVSAGELEAARKWYDPPLEEMTLECITYNPTAQRPGYLVEPAPQKGILSYVAKPERSLSGDSGSLQDYDPSLILFTPEQTVQIAIHKAAINKQISQEEKRRESSDDGDISSGEEELHDVKQYNEVSSAQRLLQLASESAKKNPSAARFHNRSSRKLRMKRANTIDIPKPANFCEYSSGDEYGASADEINPGNDRGRFSSKESGYKPPSFVPKTENDLKFLAFLKQVNDNQPKVQTYNPSAGGGKHWHNRFSSIKTAFELVEQKPPSSAPSPAKMFWQNAEAGKSPSNKDQLSKLPWTVKTDNDGVVVGSLTVAKPGCVNNFNHAPKSAFKPIEKKPVSTVSGTVKQIAAQKFSVLDSEFISKPTDKPIGKKMANSTNSNSSTSQKLTSVNSAFKDYTTKTNKYTGGSQTTGKPKTSVTNSYDKVISEHHSCGPKDVHLMNGINDVKTRFTALNNPKEQISTTPYVSNYGNKVMSKSQQNNMAAKKQFMEMPLSQNITDERKSYHSYVNNRPTNSVEESKYSNYKPLVRDTTNYLPQSYTHSYNHSSDESKYHMKPRSENYPNDTNNTSYPNNMSSLISERQIDHRRDYPEVDIVQPIIIPKEYRQPQPKDQKYPSHTTFVNAPFIPQSKKEPFDISSSSLPASGNDSGSSDFHSTPYYSQRTLEPSPPIRRDSLSKEIRHSESATASRPETLPPHHNRNVYSSKNSPYLCNPDNGYLKSPSHENKPYTTYIQCSNTTPSSSINNGIHENQNSYSNNKNSYLISTPPRTIENTPSPPSNATTPNSLDRLSPNRSYYNNLTKQGQDQRLLSAAYNSVSPSKRYDDEEGSWGNVGSVGDSPQEEKAVSRVMGQAQCQQAVTVNNRTRRRFDIDLESELKLQLKQSAQKKSLSPTFPNVIQKSESWHQMVKEQMQQAKQAPPLPKITKAKSSHMLAQPKQFEAALTPDTVTQKKITVSQYLAKQQARSVKSTKSNPKYKSTNTLYVDHEDNELDNVDEVFETIFQENTKKRNSK